VIRFAAFASLENGRKIQDTGATYVVRDRYLYSRRNRATLSSWFLPLFGTESRISAAASMSPRRTAVWYSTTDK
jgi:hypothetical protein